MKASKPYTIFLLAFLLISIITHFGLLTSKPYEIDYRYFINPSIVAIYICAIILDVFLFVLTASSVNNKITKPKLRIIKIFTQATLTILLCIIWFEIVHSSINYYGLDIQQSGLIVNNWGIIGSIIFSIYLLLLTDFNKIIKYILLVFIIAIHISLFLILVPINTLNL